MCSKLENIEVMGCWAELTSGFEPKFSIIEEALKQTTELFRLEVNELKALRDSKNEEMSRQRAVQRNLEQR